MSPRGVRVAVDPGSVRVGVAASDPDGRLAFPVTTVKQTTVEAVASELRQIVTDRGAVVVYVGLPRSLDGTEGAAAQRSREFAKLLSGALAVPVRLVDERLTTVTATRDLHSAGKSAKQQRQVADQAAAVVLLQSALDAESGSGALVGELVTDD